MTTAPAPALRFDLAAIDRKADPCVDFYDFACGGWRATHPIPPDRSKWSRYSEMEALNLEREKAIVEETMLGGVKRNPSETRVGDAYAACMDEEGIKARGLTPVRELFDAIEAVKTPDDLARLVATLHTESSEVLFELYMDPDPSNVKQAGGDLARRGLARADPWRSSSSSVQAVAAS